MSANAEPVEHEGLTEDKQDMIIELLQIIIAQNNQAFGIEFTKDDIEDELG